MQIRFVSLLAVVSLPICYCAPSQADDRRIEILRRFDRDKDGRVAPDEVPPPARPIVRRIAEQARLDASQPISIDSVKQAIAGSSAGSDSTGRSSSGSSTQKKSAREPVPEASGFVAADELKKVPGFDVPIGYVAPEEKYSSSVIRYVARIMERYDRDRNDILDPEEMKRVQWQSDPKQSDLNKDGQISTVEMYERIAKRWAKERGDDDNRGSSSRPSSTSTSSPSKSTSDPSAKMRDYAKSLLRQYDKNKNGVIDKDEWGSMRGDPAKDDLNKDGQLTLDELIVRLNNYSRGKSSGGSSGSTKSYRSRSSGGSYGSKSRGDGDKKKTYRVLSPLERLPRGLPDWFARNDKNGDGQIAMSEYAATWSNSKADEFAKYDLNRDGVITPDECLDGSKKKTK
jgi:hypothetical protein